jgi:hypothetical protein
MDEHERRRFELEGRIAKGILALGAVAALLVGSLLGLLLLADLDKHPQPSALELRESSAEAH